MGWSDVVSPVEAQTAGRWHVRQFSGTTDTYELINPRGHTSGTWWPEENGSVPGIFGFLCEIARVLNERDQVCPACHGDRPTCYCVADSGGT